MANNQMELEDEGSAGKLERFLFLMIPIIFHACTAWGIVDPI
ncbi:hypothetical protein ACFSQ7_21700 [Paenibacillus rhizoplanae]